MSIVFIEQQALPHIPIDTFVPYTLLFVFCFILPLYLISRYKPLKFIERYIPNLILPLIILSFCLCVGLDCYNQYGVTSDIKVIKTFVSGKDTCTRRSGYCHKVDVFIVSKNVSIDDKIFFDNVEEGDTVYLALQKGNLGNYFILKLKIAKNNYILDL